MREKLLLALKGVDRVKGYRWGDKPECVKRAGLGLEGLSPGAALPQPPPPFGPSFPLQRQNLFLSEPGQAPKKTGTPLPTPAEKRAWPATPGLQRSEGKETDRLGCIFPRLRGGLPPCVMCVSLLAMWGPECVCQQPQGLLACDQGVPVGGGIVWHLCGGQRWCRLATTVPGS